jgi:putative DNA methylase
LPFRIAGRDITEYRKKLIEVALPLEAINAASAKEKSIRHGHPFTLHLWWARRPLAACRAVLFASIVDDPSSRPEEFPTEEAQEQERQRLFRIIEHLVLWENTNNEEVLNAARQEILKATDGHPPPVLDPFCGGGSIPLESQRLGLEAHASDLNPVAVLITKALIEIPPKFAGMPPVNPVARKNMQRKIEGQDWSGATGLAEDVRYYGRWMRDEAEKRIGHLYPKAKLPDGSKAAVIAWIWARNVKCPNPACGAMMPLVKSFALSTKIGKEAWVEPSVDNSSNPPRINFTVRNGKGKPPDPPKVGRGAKFRCLACGQTAPDGHIKTEGVAGRMGVQLMAIVAEGKSGRIYISPEQGHETITLESEPGLVPTQPLAHDPRNIWCVNYGLDTFNKLFTHRQLIALTTFSDLATEASLRVLHDIGSTCLSAEFNSGEIGREARTYSNAISTYLAFLVDQLSDHQSNICGWNSINSQMRTVFARQAIPMTWDFAESNPFCESSGSYHNLFERLVKGFSSIPANSEGYAKQFDIGTTLDTSEKYLISTDPPYYDNVSYSDLSDFFYVWLKRSIGQFYPDLFSTILSPKEQELVANPYRFDGNKYRAQQFFEDGLRRAFGLIRNSQNPDFPTTVFYAFKQSEHDNSKGAEGGKISTGWETMLEGLVKSGFLITGTWPIYTEKKGRTIGIGTNALASSIVLVCRPRHEDAPLSTRRDFLNSLKQELPEALRQLQRGNIAPVDLAQAAIGPGMAIFSRYSKILEADGSTMRVRTALQLINQHLDEYLSEQEGEYDPDTRWTLSWFEQYGMKEGSFGDAETLSKAKNISVEGLVQSGILKAGGGKVRLLKREEMDPDWDPSTDTRLSVWEMTQHLIRILENNGEDAASDLQQKLEGAAEIARDLAYRLYAICERKGWAQEAISYNGLVTAWPRLRDLSAEKKKGSEQQGIRSYLSDNQ